MGESPMKCLKHLTLVMLLLGSTWAQKCIQCTKVPFPVSRISGPSDVEMAEARVVGEGTGTIFAVRHWFDGRRSQARFMEGIAGKQWIDLAMGRQNHAARNVIYASGFGKTRILLRQDITGAMERSEDSGKSWRKLRFIIDGKPASEWVQTFDNTPGTQLVPQLVTVSHVEPATLYLTFRAWIPDSGRLTESWKDIPGMYVSHDGGNSWTLFSKDLVSESPLGIDGKDPNFVVGVGKGGLVKSYDGGRTWTAVGEQAFFNQEAEIEGRSAKLAELKSRGILIPNAEKGDKIRIDQIELSPTDKKTIYLRTNIGLIISRDGGSTWCIAGLGNQVFDEVNGLIVSRSKPNEIIISTTSKVHIISATSKVQHARIVPAQILRSTDAGCTFKVLYTMRQGI